MATQTLEQTTTTEATPSTTWQLDASHTRASFAAKHMMITTVRGSLGAVSGTIQFDPANPLAASVTATIDTAGLNTHDEKRDAHLRSADFLDVENYPTITFQSTRIAQKGENEFAVTGDLTIRGTTRPVTLAVEFEGLEKSPWGTQAAAFHATTKISRKDWNLTWNVALESGGMLVSDELKIEVDVEAIRQ